MAWKGYAAVSAAKVSLEALCRSIATEFGALRRALQRHPGRRHRDAGAAAIPGSDHSRPRRAGRNPGGRLTTPRDVANVIYLLTLDEASWINGEVIRVDGGEHVSGVTS